jgi:hypothetical protein
VRRIFVHPAITFVAVWLTLVFLSGIALDNFLYSQWSCGCYVPWERFSTPIFLVSFWGGLGFLVLNFIRGILLKRTRIWVLSFGLGGIVALTVFLVMYFTNILRCFMFDAQPQPLRQCFQQLISG